MKIPFDTKFKPQIESGEYKVETRDGHPARIVCWDKKSRIHPIIALVTNSEGNENTRWVTEKGCVYAVGTKADDDLFIITPEPELSEFENACIQLYQDGCSDGLAGDRLCNEALKVASADLLNLAKKEALKELQENLYFNDIFRVPEWLREILVTTKENGKKEALKDLPRWKKVDVDMGNGISAESNIVPRLYDSEELCFCYEGSYLLISDLKKLPGFKEDEQ